MNQNADYFVLGRVSKMVSSRMLNFMINLIVVSGVTRSSMLIKFDLCSSESSVDCSLATF